MSEPLGAIEGPWLRLDKRMLLVHPVTEVVKFVPVLAASVILGTSSGNHGWSVLPLALVVGFALSRWFTTAYRVGDTHVELRTGLLRRKTLSAPRSRIRSVDIEADPLHRVLGLAVVVIGTGQHADSGEKFRLDALDARLVPQLRKTLLGHDDRVGDESIPLSGKDSRPAREIAHWKPGWVRYAPLSLTGFAIIGPLVGVAFQYGLGEAAFRSDAVRDVGSGGVRTVVIAVAVLILTVFVLVAAASCARYLATYSGLRVTDDGKTLQLRHGLFTRRQVTLDLARLRGATVQEPLLLRLAGGAELQAIMTGQNPRQKILPQAPREAVAHTLGHLLAADRVPSDGLHPGAEFAPDAEPLPSLSPAPATVPLTRHGGAARRRRHTRALAPVVLAAVALLGLSLVQPALSPWWWLGPTAALPIALALAEDRYRGLGHTVLPATAGAPTWLITRSGSLDRERDCLTAPGVIGWTVRQSFFQRRAGLATVVAATAAGKKRYAVIDVPLEQAWELVEAVTPGMLGSR